MTLGERMVRYRAKERINQSELARRCGVTTQTVSNVERGIQDPSRVTVQKIELVIGRQEEE